MPRLVSLKVCGSCFTYVNELKLIGLHCLEDVTILDNCFVKSKNSDSDNPEGCFCLKNCQKLKRLFINYGSFDNYSTCEIENNCSLEVIDMGLLDSYFGVFTHASLTLRSNSHQLRSWNRPTKTKDLQIWVGCFLALYACCI